MRAFVQTGIGAFEEQDLPSPVPGPGEVILRMRSALTCGTDVKILERGHSRIPLPLTMGHELCGEIARVGPGVDGWSVGERVVPGISGPCGSCAECNAGQANLCVSGLAARSWGAFAEEVRVPAPVVAANLHRVPDGLDDEAAAFLDPLAAVLHGWSRLRDPSRTLLVYGAGALAYLWTAVARRHGLDVIIAGRRAERAPLAGRHGARFADVSQGDPREILESLGDAPDIAVDCTGDPGIWEMLPSLVRPGGQVLLFGGCAPGTRVAFDAARLHYSEIALIGAFHYTPAKARAAIQALGAGDVDPRPLISGRGSLGDLPRLLQAHARGEGVRYAIRGGA